MRYAVALFTGLFAVWLLWSGHYAPKLVAFGALSCGLVVAITLRMDRFDGVALRYVLGLRPLLYLPWLIAEIAKANLQVARVILSPGLPIQPQLVRVPASQITELAQVVHANSITLTPGTITLDLRDGYLLVHALTESAARALESGEIDRRVSRLEAFAD